MVSLPFEHLERVTAVLRSELRRQPLAADVHEMPKWKTLDVTGATESTELRGCTRNQCRATAERRQPFECATTLTRPDQLRAESG
jgi:hypothetical protein